MFPILANHDVWPVGIQDFSKPYSNEALRGVASAWRLFLDDQALDSIRKYGYYSTILKKSDGTVVPSTKVIGLNT